MAFVAWLKGSRLKATDMRVPGHSNGQPRKRYGPYRVFSGAGLASDGGTSRSPDGADEMGVYSIKVISS